MNTLTSNGNFTIIKAMHYMLNNANICEIVMTEKLFEKVLVMKLLRATQLQIT